MKIRGTEPRLTHITLDGVNLASPETVRQIKLDLIPADLVESVQINKALQADIEGDGIGGSVDLRSIYLKYLYSHFDNFGDDWIYSPAINTFASQFQGGNDGTVSFTALRRRPVQDIGGLQLGGHHVLRHSLFSWDIDSSVARTRDQGYGTAHFSPQGDSNPLNAITYGLDISHPLTPHIHVQDGVNILDPTRLFYTGQSLRYFYNPEIDLGFGASLTVPYSVAGHASTFEVGGRFRNVHKFVNQNTQNYVPTAANAADPSCAQTNFLNSFSDPGYYGGTYKFGPAVITARYSPSLVRYWTTPLLATPLTRLRKSSLVTS